MTSQTCVWITSICATEQDSSWSTCHFRLSPDAIVPAYLYKFVADAGALPSILQGRVRFTPIPELNDPSELVPKLNAAAVRESLSRMRERGYTADDFEQLRRQGQLMARLAPECQVVKVPGTPEEATARIRSPFYDSIEQLEESLVETGRVMSSRVGLFCLSRRYDALPMWAHYAANAEGIVVEFRGLENVFAGDGSGVLRQPTEVQYGQDQIGVTFDPQSHRSIFFSKFEDWRYEQEVRIVLPLDECRFEVVKGRTLNLSDVPADCVARILVGWKMSEDQISAVKGDVAQFNPDVKVARARYVRGRVVIDAL